MKVLHVALTLLVLLCYLCVYTQSKQCVRFQDSPLKACSGAGYNYTYALPDDLSGRTISGIQRFLFYIVRVAQNCSVVQMAESIACMSYAPKCQDANKDPVLPCRRVCSELMKRCYNVTNPWAMDFLMKQCYVLADETAASGKCYEPKNFIKYYNPNVKGPLERGCQKIVNFPFCKNMGYNYTIITAQAQARAYRFMYRKNITDPNPETPRPGSILARVMSQMKSSPKCANSVQKIFCSEMIPPCFQDEGPHYYTVCKPICKNIGEVCPELLTGRGQFYYGECERMAPGISSHGYCKHSKLPPIIDWGDYFGRKRPTPTPPKKGLSKTVIAIISVAVVAFIAVTIIAIVFVAKKRKQKSMFDYQRHT